jgi:hypothetical protein
MLAQDRLSAMASNKIAYIVNVKTKGKVHLSIAEPQNGKRLVKCGWCMTKSTSRVFNCYHLKYGELCKRCFTIEGKEKGQDDEEIEQFIENS